MDDEQAGRIINDAPDGWTIVAVAVPTRALRLIRDSSAIRFRVEQLQPSPAGIYSWCPISAHAGDDPWESLGPGIQDMINKQARYKLKIEHAQHERNMAQIKAENPLAH